jgi:anthranilate/para-aminobenzoate synthase component I
MRDLLGGGVVWDSDPAAEVEASWTKAAPLLATVGSRFPEAALS